MYRLGPETLAAGPCIQFAQYGASWLSVDPGLDPAELIEDARQLNMHRAVDFVGAGRIAIDLCPLRRVGSSPALLRDKMSTVDEAREPADSCQRAHRHSW